MTDDNGSWWQRDRRYNQIFEVDFCNGRRVMVFACCDDAACDIAMRSYLKQFQTIAIPRVLVWTRSLPMFDRGDRRPAPTYMTAER